MEHYYVTGSSRGIGRALVERLLQDSETMVTGLARNPGPEHERYRHVRIDLSDVESADNFRFEAAGDANRIVLVNNAGILEPRQMGNLEARNILFSYAANVIAPVMLMNRFVATFKDSGCELVICSISSRAATDVIPGSAMYSGQKAALEATTRVVAVEAEARGDSRLTCIIVDPGAVDTDMQAVLRESKPEDFPNVEMVRGFHKSGGLASVEDVAAKLEYLLRDPTRAPQMRVMLHEISLPE